MNWKGFINGIFNNFWAKIISLILAVATWFYIFDLIHNSESFPDRGGDASAIFSRYNFSMKTVPVKPVFIGKSPDGYLMDFNRVQIVPSEITILGPQGIIKDVNELKTDSIDVSEYTRSVKLTVGVHSDEKNLPLKNQRVEIYIPVEQIKK